MARFELLHVERAHDLDAAAGEPSLRARTETARNAFSQLPTLYDPDRTLEWTIDCAGPT